jgi:hypothetical protein
VFYNASVIWGVVRMRGYKFREPLDGSRRPTRPVMKQCAITSVKESVRYNAISLIRVRHWLALCVATGEDFGAGYGFAVKYHLSQKIHANCTLT